MKKITRIILAGLGLSLVSFVLAFFNSRPTSGQLPPPVVPVRVTNTPLPVQGSVSASISNTVPVSGNVNASESGAWNVGVNNFPATQNVSFNGAQPVSFSNTPSTPLFNRDTDNPARQPVIGGCGLPNVTPPAAGAFLTCNLTLITESGAPLTTVPAGQRLVIETVTGLAEMPTGTIPARFLLITQIANQMIPWVTVPQKIGAETQFYDMYAVSEQLRLYADPGTTVVFQFEPTTNQQITAVVNISGYLVNVP